jgi:hypothetical protein
MNMAQQSLQRAISARRERRRPLTGWVLLSCPNVKCSVRECNVFVEEGDGALPFQAPCRCPRCMGELDFEGIEEERGR